MKECLIGTYVQCVLLSGPEELATDAAHQPDELDGGRVDLFLRQGDPAPAGRAAQAKDRGDAGAEAGGAEVAAEEAAGEDPLAGTSCTK